MSEQVAAELVKLAAAELGGPGAPDAQRCAQAAIEALGRLAGPGLRLATFSIDMASHVLGAGEVEIALRADKRTKSIVFASAEGRCGGKPVFTAQGLFSKQGTST